MRKIIAFVILFISLVVNAQGANPFSEAEDVAINYSTESSSQAMPAGPDNGKGGMRDLPDCDGDGIPDDLDDECAPNPSDPVPIDDYLPLLLITAVGIIVHAGWRNRKQTA